MATALDPLGRLLMRQLIQLRARDGLPMASSTTFRTFTQSGTFSWEATRIEAGPIPASVWEAPKDYRRIHL